MEKIIFFATFFTKKNKTTIFKTKKKIDNRKSRNVKSRNAENQKT